MPRFDVRTIANQTNLDVPSVDMQLSPSRLLQLVPTHSNLTLTLISDEGEQEDAEEEAEADGVQAPAPDPGQVTDIIDIGDTVTSSTFLSVFGYYSELTDLVGPVQIVDAKMAGEPGRETIMIQFDALESSEYADTGTTYRGFWINIVPLREEPMEPRRSDRRIGYFSQCFKLAGGKEEYAGGVPEELQDQDESVCYINRWPLERRDGACEADCEAVEPIRYHIDPSVPERWCVTLLTPSRTHSLTRALFHSLTRSLARSLTHSVRRHCIARGVDQWNVAFSAAGWRDGTIRGVLPGDAAWPEDYHALDSRYSSISWTFNDAGYAVGPSEADPRSGEILNADIVFDEVWVRALEGRYVRRGHWKGEGARGADDEADRLVSAGALFSLSASSLNSTRLQEYVCAGLTDVAMHEVGHTLGLRHNFRGSFAFNWLDERETQQPSASVMDYNAYVWRNESVPEQLPFLKEPGLYDIWAIRYGYGIADAEALRAIADEEDAAYAFCTDDDLRGGFAEHSDPSCSTRDLSNDTTLFFKEYAMVVDELKRNAFSDEFLTLKGNVASVTGNLLYVLRTLADGAELVAKHIGGSLVGKVEKRARGDKVLPVDAATQRAAAAFVRDVLVSDEILYPPRAEAAKLVAVGTLERSWVSGAYLGLESTPVNVAAFVRGLKSGLLDAVFAVERLARMEHDAWASEEGGALGALLGARDAFGVGEFLQLFNEGVMGELSTEVRIELAEGELPPGGGPFACPAGTLRTIGGAVAALRRMSAERHFVMAAWVKKLVEMAGTGLNAHTMVELLPSASGYASDTAYARSAIGVLDALSMQIDCVLQSIATEAESFNEVSVMPLYQHLRLLRAEIGRGWWRGEAAG